MTKRILIIFLTTITGLSVTALAQDQNAGQAKQAADHKTSTKKPNTKLISKGVINDRALIFVEPDYPPAAGELTISGKVRVEVVLDEAGYVIEAKALTGHSLLTKPSVEAAKNSKFAPFFLDQEPIRVKGIIIYNFKTNKLNWLEIAFYSPETERIKRFLPDNFIEEKHIITKMNATDTPYDPDGYNNLVFSIENKLRFDEKNLWLFRLGLIFRKLVDNQSDQEKKINSVTEIQTLLSLKPENVSSNLIENLKTMVKLNQQDLEKFDKKLQVIINKFYIFGR